MDRITNILQSNAPQPPQMPTDPMAAWQAQNPTGYSNPSIDAATSIVQQAQGGNQQAMAAVNTAKKLANGNPQTAYDFLNFTHDLPEQIDPTNTYQVMNAWARFQKQGNYQAEMPSPIQLATQDAANVFNGKGSNILGLEQESAKNLAMVGKWQSGGGAGGGGVTGFVYNKMKSALEAAGVEVTPQMELEIINVSRNGLQKGATITVNGKQIAVENIIGAEAAAAAMEGAKQDATNRSDYEWKPATAGRVEEEKPLGQNRGEKEVLIGQMTARVPQLLDVTQRLSKAGKIATYTSTGKLWNVVNKETGFDPREAAIARTDYISIVDNEVLPLLRETFGAQFTQKEGESLKITLGDPDKTPQEKDAVLRSFMTSKMGTINSIARELGKPEPFSRQDISDVLAQISISSAPSTGGGVKFLGFE